MSKEERKVPELRFKGFHDDWEQRKVEDLSFVSTGKKDTQDAIMNGDYDFYVRSPKIEKINSYSYDGEAVLTVGDGVGVGKVFHYVNGKFDYHQRVYKISDFKNYNGLFFYYYFSDNFKYETRKYNAKTSVDSVRREMITKMNVPYTSLFEQNQVGQFLKRIDNIITLHQRKIQILEIIKKEFVRNMLPRHLEKTPNIRFRNINSDWRKDKAKEIFTPITEKNQEELPVLSISQEEGVIYRKDVGKNIQYDPTTLKNYKVVRPDDFIISLRSFQGGFELSNISGITSPAYTVFALKDQSKNDKEFWRTYFKSYKFIESLKTVTFGIRDGRSISYSEFSSLNLSYPSTKNEQNTIGLFFKRIDKVIAINQNKIQKLQHLKASYLHKMFL